jgi:predicted transcriptional regulator
MIIFVSINDTKNYKKMIAEIEKYIEIQNNIDQILKDSPLKMSYIIEKSGIKKPTFFKKLKDKRFTPEELLIIAKNVETRVWRNETKEEILESLKRSEEDIKHGRVHDFYEVMAEVKERIQKYKNESTIH